MTRFALLKPTTNLTIYSGPSRSGKTDALNQAQKHARNNGRTQVFFTGTATEQAIRSYLGEPTPRHFFWDDGPQGAVDIAKKVAADFPQTHFHVASY